jgi:hypothetical protein
MYEILCEKCKQPLLYDYSSTLEACLKNISYNTDKVEKIQDRWLSNYLIYKCGSCSCLYQYTFKEVEEKVREVIAKDVMNFKKSTMF